MLSRWIEYILISNASDLLCTDDFWSAFNFSMIQANLKRNHVGFESVLSIFVSDCLMHQLKQSQRLKAEMVDFLGLFEVKGESLEDS